MFSPVASPWSFSDGFLLFFSACIFQHKQLDFLDQSKASSVAPPCLFTGSFSSNCEFSTIIWELIYDLFFFSKFSPPHSFPSPLN